MSLNSWLLSTHLYRLSPCAPWISLFLRVDVSDQDNVKELLQGNRLNWRFQVGRGCRESRRDLLVALAVFHGFEVILLECWIILVLVESFAILQMTDTKHEYYTFFSKSDITPITFQLSLFTYIWGIPCQLDQRVTLTLSDMLRDFL